MPSQRAGETPALRQEAKVRCSIRHRPPGGVIASVLSGRNRRGEFPHSELLRNAYWLLRLIANSPRLQAGTRLVFL